MNPLSWTRHPAVNYHFEEGNSWLLQSKRGKRCTALAYAAFEFRLAIERVIFQYWLTINGDSISGENVNDVRSFTRMLNKIYKFGGNQRIINKHFEFMQITLDCLQIDKQLVTPDLGKLHNFWGECSELCHITWTISPKERKFKRQVFGTLEEITKEEVIEYLKNIGLWGVQSNRDKTDNQFIGKPLKPNKNKI